MNIFNYMVEYCAADDRTLDDALSALADPTRRAIMAALREGELRVTEIAAPFDMSLNAVSKHVKKLESANLVQRRRIGREHFVSAKPATIEKTAQWFDAQRKFWNTRLDKLETLMMEEERDE
ncbi:MAG: transcriptional regulator [Hyphococcus sp.]|nr:MAG: transcriptional regulator [Marinicaulis sp.]